MFSLIAIVTISGVALVILFRYRWSARRARVLTAYASTHGFDVIVDDVAETVNWFSSTTAFTSLNIPIVIQGSDRLLFDFSGFTQGGIGVEMRQTVFAMKLHQAIDYVLLFINNRTPDWFVNQTFKRYDNETVNLQPNIAVYVNNLSECKNGYIQKIMDVCSEQMINIGISGEYMFLYKSSSLVREKNIDKQFSLLEKLMNLIQL